MKRKAITLALSTAILFSSSLHAPAQADDLDAYRALARTPATDTLLVAARRALTDAPADTLALPDWPAAPVAVYVSLLDAANRTRACVGSTQPIGGTLGTTVTALAREVRSADRRRPPVHADELAALRIVISFAGRGEPVSDPMGVDPAREGLLVTTARGSVAYLPGEVRTVAFALRQARQAGILTSARDGAYRRFPVVALPEPRPAAASRPVPEDSR